MARELLTKLFILFFLAGCDSAGERDFKKASEEIQSGHFRIASSLLEKVMARDPENKLAIEAAREGARISFYEIKDFKKTADFYRHIVLYSKDSAERLKAQKQIADIYFGQMTDYKQAVIELNKAISMLSEPDDVAKYKVNLARAYYYQNNFFQAESEVDEFLRGKTSNENRFEMLVLKGNIFIAKKEIPKAAEVFKELIKNFPEKSAKESVYLTLAVAYEEMKDYKSSIETLQELKAHHPMPEYIDIRINRLKERIKIQPGARGIRK
jgi:tetratricopeptide (TPR) repeat protein